MRCMNGHFNVLKHTVYRLQIIGDVYIRRGHDPLDSQLTFWFGKIHILPEKSRLRLFNGVKFWNVMTTIRGSMVSSILTWQVFGEKLTFRILISSNQNSNRATRLGWFENNPDRGVFFEGSTSPWFHCFVFFFSLSSHPSIVEEYKYFAWQTAA